MKSILLLLSFSLFLAASTAKAEETVASEQSIRELLAITQSKKMLDGVWTQMEQVMDSSFKSALQGKNINEDEQKIYDDMKADLFVVLKDEMSWDILEGQLIAIYQKSFTQAEIDDLTQFYLSPVGQAFIQKMPTVMQNTMATTQQNIRRLQPRVQMVMETMSKRMKELHANQNTKQP